MNHPVLVTGAMGDIGRAVVARLARAGLPVIATDRVEADADLLGDAACCLRADLPDGIEALADRLPDKIGAIVHVAGIIHTHPATSIDREIFDAIFTTNVFAPLDLVSKIHDRLVDGGSIVFVGSLAGLRASPSNLLYGASKAALHNAAKSLASDLSGRGVRVNVVAPGLIDTTLTDRTNEDLGALRRRSAEDMARDRSDKIPIGRIGRPEDVAGCVAYLLSDEAGFVTGAEFLITGGGHL